MQEKAFTRLVGIMDELRQKCPWDRKQTIHTLRQMTIEETYELCDAITEENWEGMKEELGDLLLHIVFYAKIATEKNMFTITDVINTVCDKLIQRHPHVYKPGVKDEDLHEVKNEDDVKKNWEKIKLKSGKKSVLSGVPKSLPALSKAMRLQEKARQSGFDWNSRSQVWEKVNEELGELQHEVRQGDATKINHELGDVFFSLINYARFLETDPEVALEHTNKKFIKRFMKMEDIAAKSKKALQDLSLEEMEAIWNQVKKDET